jgi:hypothetical protein
MLMCLKMSGTRVTTKRRAKSALQPPVSILPRLGQASGSSCLSCTHVSVLARLLKPQRSQRSVGCAGRRGSNGCVSRSRSVQSCKNLYVYRIEHVGTMCICVDLMGCSRFRCFAFHLHQSGHATCKYASRAGLKDAKLHPCLHFCRPLSP